MIFHESFFAFVNMGHHEANNFKTLLLTQMPFAYLQTSPESCFSVVLTKLLFWVFEILVYDFFFHDFCSFSLTWEPMAE